jgi:hypothetical protein
MQGFTSIPFKTESAHGIKTVIGVAKFSGAGVVLEWVWILLGLFGSGVREVRLSKEEIVGG